MRRRFPLMMLLSSWIAFISLFFFDFINFSNNFGGILYIGISFYFLLIGSFIFIKLPDYPPTSFFLYLMTCLSFLFLFIYSENTVFNILGLFFLSLSPIMLHLFLFSFIQSKNNKKLMINLTILIITTILSFISFYKVIYPEIGLVVLLLVSTIISYFTIRKEKQLFFSNLSYRILSYSILAAFFPFLITYSLPDIFGANTYYGGHLTVIFVTLFPTCIAFILIKNQLLTLSRNLINYLLIFIASSCSAAYFQLISSNENSFGKIFILIYISSNLAYLLIHLYERLMISHLRKKQRVFSNERVELLTQVTYSEFFYQSKSLLNSRLNELIKSKHFLLLSEKDNRYMTIIKRGRFNTKELIKKIPYIYPKDNTINIENRTCEVIRINQPEQILWLFYLQTPDSASDTEITDFLQQYSVITKTVRLLHDAQKQSTEASLNLEVLLQEKLFTSIEREKTNYTHYLHDEVLQTIIALNTLMMQLEGDPEIIGLATLEFSKLIASIRQEIFNTAPSTLYHIPFEDNVAILMQDFNQRYPDSHFQLRHRVSQQPPEFVIAPIYRIIKELNENSAKHAHGTLVETTLEITADVLTLSVEDNGVGIASFAQLEKELIHKKGHIGLLSIKNDVHWLNGTFEMMPSGKYKTGTQFNLTIPLKIVEGTNENTIN